MAKLTESYLRKIIKEELKSIIISESLRGTNLFETTPAELIAALQKSGENDAVLQELKKHTEHPVVSLGSVDNTYTKFLVYLAPAAEAYNFSLTGRSKFGNIESIDGKGFITSKTVNLLPRSRQQMTGQKYLEQNIRSK